MKLPGIGVVPGLMVIVFGEGSSVSRVKVAVVVVLPSAVGFGFGAAISVQLQWRSVQSPAFHFCGAAMMMVPSEEQDVHHTLLHSAPDVPLQLS
jgi:hypothetical protein